MINRLVLLIALVTIAIVNAESNADLVNAKVERSIDLTSHLAYVTNKITVENKAASGSFKSYSFVVDPSKSKSIAFVGAHLPANKGETAEEAEKRKLNVVQTSQDAK